MRPSHGVITAVGTATLLGGVCGVLAVLFTPRVDDVQAELLRDVRTLSVTLPSADDLDAHSRARLCLQRLLRARDDLMGASCWLQSAFGDRDVFVAEGDVGDPAALRGYVGLDMPSIVTPQSATAPVFASDGSSQGVVLLRSRRPTGASVPVWPFAVTVVAALAALLARQRFGQALDRISKLCGAERRPQGIGELADILVDNRSDARIDSRISRQVRVRTRDLEQSLRQRDEHVAMTAHELRTPLTVVLASVEMVRDGYAVTEEERRQFLEQATTSGQHMLLLLNDLLDRAAFEAGKLRVEMAPCFVDDLLGDAMRLLTPAAVARHTSIAVEIGDDVERAVLADPGRVLQVVFNLVSNALKYSPAGSPVEVRALAEDRGVLIEIEDRGMGIAPEAQRHLFKRFSRVHDASSSDASGSGIGLHVSKALIESMGGEIGFRSRDGGLGSVFWFRLGWEPGERRVEEPSAIATPS